MKVDIGDQIGLCGSTIEALHKTVYSRFANTADLIVIAGDADVSAEASVASALGLGGDGDDGEDDDVGETEVEGAIAELRRHLLLASNLSPPTMYAASRSLLHGAYALCRGIIPLKFFLGMSLWVLKSRDSAQMPNSG
jgi:hypothetical protein